jgi:hypothetical protein
MFLFRCVILFAIQYRLLTITRITPPGRSNLLFELLAGPARNEFPSGPNSSLWLYERPLMVALHGDQSN